MSLWNSRRQTWAEVRMQAHDGLLLNGWHAVSHAGGNRPRPLILYFSGASGHRGYRIQEIELFARLGCDLLLADYRGYGDNQGQPSEGLIARDARTLWRFATETLGVPSGRIVIVGESVGGAVGTRLASELCPAGDPAGRACAPGHIRLHVDVVSQFFPRVLANIFLVDRYPSIRRISHVSCPLLSIHGTEDRLIPIEMGRPVCHQAPQTSAGGVPKRFLEAARDGHNDILEERMEIVEAELAAFLARALPEFATVSRSLRVRDQP